MKQNVSTKEERAKQPVKIFVSMNAPPLAVYNLYAVLADDESPIQIKTCTDFICVPAPPADVAG